VSGNHERNRCRADLLRIPCRDASWRPCRCLLCGGLLMTIGSHQRTIGATQSWITPQWILNALGRFDLDPCECDPQPWKCADVGYTTNGLEQPWFGRVWLNPPFDRRDVGRWMKRLAQHGRGTALIHARTEAAWFEPVWQSASAILFLADRIHFHRPDGARASANSGAPAVLVAFGGADKIILRGSGIRGAFVTQWAPAP
jgi:hypothetical protein